MTRAKPMPWALVLAHGLNHGFDPCAEATVAPSWPQPALTAPTASGHGQPLNRCRWLFICYTYYIYIYIYVYMCIFPKQRRHVKVGVLTSSSIVTPLPVRIAGRQVPMPRCLSPAAHGLPLPVRIAGRQVSEVPKPRCPSPDANSLNFRIAGRQGPKPRCPSPKNTPFVFPRCARKDV